MTEETAERAATAGLGRAWSAYLEGLERLGRAVESDDHFGGDDQVRAHRYLAGLALLAHDQILRGVSSDHPTFVRTGCTPGRDWGFSNADTFYLAAQIDGSRQYTIRGQIGSVSQTIFGAYYRDLGGSHAGMHSTELQADADGTVTIAVGPTQPEGAVNWLPTNADVGTIAIYQVRADWEDERRGWFTITADGAAGVPASPLELDDPIAQLGSIGAEAAKIAEAWKQIGRFQFADATPHHFDPPADIQIAMRGAKFSAALWEVPAGKALVIESRPVPDATYWGWATYTLLGTHLEFANRQTSLNHTQATPDADGKVRIVLAPTDPGVWNWIDTAETSRGVVNWRISTDSEVSAPVATLVDLTDLAAHLPDSTRRCGPDERSAAITERQRSVARWYAE